MILFSPSVLSGDDNGKMCSCLWTESSFDSNEIRYMQENLHSAINYLKVFEDTLGFRVRVCQAKDNLILFILSGQLGCVIVTLTHTFKQIDFTYVNYLSLSRHHDLALKFIKTPTIITNLDEIIEKIKMSPKSENKCFRETLPFSVCNVDCNIELSSTMINANFLRSQLFIRALLYLPYDRTSRDKFFDLCRREYEGNPAQLSEIEKLEASYTPEQALRWYSKDGFLFRMLNKALRVHDINTLFSFRFFIQDLCEQLRQIQRKQGRKQFHVYRGQYISKQELNLLKKSKGQFISMNSFLSTSHNREISRMFIQDKLADLCGVLFEIDIDSCFPCERNIFADISLESHFRDEREVLFMLGTIFRLVDIREENEFTVIRMRLCHGNYDRDMEPLLEQIQMENDESRLCFLFGDVLHKAGMYDQAEQFYNRMLNQLENDHPLIAELWGGIGLVKKAKEEIEISSQWLNKALEKYKQMNDPEGIAKSLLNLGSIHQKKKEFDEAIDKYNQALKMFCGLPGDRSESVANCFQNLGTIYSKQCKFTEAIDHYMVALNIRKTSLTLMHRNTAETVNNIANVYSRDHQYDRALRHYKQALEIFNISLSFEHPSVAQTYYNAGLVYLKKNDSQQSLIFLNRAVSIYHNILSPNHPELRRCIDTMNFIKQGTTK